MENILILALLVSLGYFFGRNAEKRHYKSIEQRERDFLELAATSSKFPLADPDRIDRCSLAKGSVVISVDYFKRMLAALRNIFGGSVQSYETLLDRARREAVLRLKESCSEADEIINMRIETSSISKGVQSTIGSVEVLAYGTAIYYREPK